MFATSITYRWLNVLFWYNAYQIWLLTSLMETGSIQLLNTDYERIKCSKSHWGIAEVVNAVKNNCHFHYFYMNSITSFRVRICDQRCFLMWVPIFRRFFMKEFYTKKLSTPLKIKHIRFQVLYTSKAWSAPNKKCFLKLNLISGELPGNKKTEAENFVLKSSHSWIWS